MATPTCGWAKGVCGPRRELSTDKTRFRVTIEEHHLVIAIIPFSWGPHLLGSHRRDPAPFQRVRDVGTVSPPIVATARHRHATDASHERQR